MMKLLLLLLLVELLLVVLHHLVVHLLHLVLRERRRRGEEVADRVLLRLCPQGGDTVAPEIEQIIPYFVECTVGGTTRVGYGMYISSILFKFF